jgi:hypothetical protein
MNICSIPDPLTHKRAAPSAQETRPPPRPSGRRSHGFGAAVDHHNKNQAGHNKNQADRNKNQAGWKENQTGGNKIKISSRRDVLVVIVTLQLVMAISSLGSSAHFAPRRPQSRETGFGKAALNLSMEF